MNLMNECVIVNVGTEKRHTGHTTSYYSKKGAKIVCSKLNKKFGSTQQWVVMMTAEYNARPVKMRKVMNKMTGVMVDEPVDTPYGCSVGDDAYWQN